MDFDQCFGDKREKWGNAQSTYPLDLECISLRMVIEGHLGAPCWSFHIGTCGKKSTPEESHCWKSWNHSCFDCSILLRMSTLVLAVPTHILLGGRIFGLWPSHRWKWLPRTRLPSHPSQFIQVIAVTIRGAHRIRSVLFSLSCIAIWELIGITGFIQLHTFPSLHEVHCHCRATWEGPSLLKLYHSQGLPQQEKGIFFKPSLSSLSRAMVCLPKSHYGKRSQGTSQQEKGRCFKNLPSLITSLLLLRCTPGRMQLGKGRFLNTFLVSVRQALAMVWLREWKNDF